MKKAIKNIFDPIHEWFGLSYANYLTIPRTVLQSMPDKWQSKFVKLLNELDEKDWMEKDINYFVQTKSDKGRYKKDPLADYQRGRRKIFNK